MVKLRLQKPKLSLPNPSPADEALAATWMFFITIVVLIFILGVGERLIHARQDRLEKALAELASRHTLLDTQFTACTSGVHAWNKWLKLRDEGWGAGLFMGQGEVSADE